GGGGLGGCSCGGRRFGGRVRSGGGRTLSGGSRTFSGRCRSGRRILGRRFRGSGAGICGRRGRFGRRVHSRLGRRVHSGRARCFRSRSGRRFRGSGAVGHRCGGVVSHGFREFRVGLRRCVWCGWCIGGGVGDVV